jgi:hypothetical protein
VIISNIPILLLDLEGFSTLNGVAEKRAILQQLQQILSQAARFFMPFGDPWSKWRRHGTGDGYYFLFDGHLGPQVALRYYLSIAEQLASYNNGVGVTFPIRIRAILAHGDVELVDDQYLSEEFIQAERLISDAAFKKFASTRPQLAATLAVTNLFFHTLQRQLSDTELFPEAKLREIKWNDLKAVDKHGKIHQGKVEGVDWKSFAELQEIAQRQDRFRLGILLGHSRETELPEARGMVQAALNVLRQSKLAIDLWIDQASEGALRRLAQRGCDLLIFYGHGNKEGTLELVEGPRDFDQLARTLGIEQFWQELRGAIIFACCGDKFATDLPCPCISFNDDLLSNVPRAYLVALFTELRNRPWSEAIVEAQRHAIENMHTSFSDVLTLSAKPWPSTRVANGMPIVERASPRLLGTLEDDIANIRLFKEIYHPFDPFVGRSTILNMLYNNIPNRYSEDWQSRYWVWGDHGIGKTALLREYAIQVSDFKYADAIEPVWLLHAYCESIATSEKFENMICQRANQLYCSLENWKKPQSLKKLFEMLGNANGVHVWLLDDLTDLNHRQAPPDQAFIIPNRIYELSEQYQIPMQVVVSATSKGPSCWNCVEIKSLDKRAIIDLAESVYRMERSAYTKDIIVAPREVLALFDECCGSTAHFKRALILAARAQEPPGEYLKKMKIPGQAVASEHHQMSLKMVRREIEQLDNFAVQDCFKYREFLEILLKLISTVEYFTREELEKWYGDRFLVTDKCPMTRSVAYDNGLAQLLRLGFVSVRKRQGQIRWTMPPSQRLVLQALGQNGVAGGLPPNLPNRSSSG